MTSSRSAAMLHLNAAVAAVDGFTRPVEAFLSSDTDRMRPFTVFLDAPAHQRVFPISGEFHLRDGSSPSVYLAPDYTGDREVAAALWERHRAQGWATRHAEEVHPNGELIRVWFQLHRSDWPAWVQGEGLDWPSALAHAVLRAAEAREARHRAFRAAFVTQDALDHAVRDTDLADELRNTLANLLGVAEDEVGRHVGSATTWTPIILLTSEHGVLQTPQRVDIGGEPQSALLEGLSHAIPRFRSTEYPLPLGVQIVYAMQGRIYCMAPDPAYLGTILDAAEFRFHELRWQRVDERGTWEAEIDGEVVSCPQSTDPSLNRPHAVEMIVATRCQSCGGRLRHDTPLGKRSVGGLEEDLGRG